MLRFTLVAGHSSRKFALIAADGRDAAELCQALDRQGDQQQAAAAAVAAAEQQQRFLHAPSTSEFRAWRWPVCHSSLSLFLAFLSSLRPSRRCGGRGGEFARCGVPAGERPANHSSPGGQHSKPFEAGSASVHRQVKESVCARGRAEAVWRGGKRGVALFVVRCVAASCVLCRNLDPRTSSTGGARRVRTSEAALRAGQGGGEGSYDIKDYFVE